jgi:hypothetical protein
MLFLRALLFFILGTFALAFPIFPDHKSVDADVRQRMAGYWRSPVSENLSHLIWSLIYFDRVSFARLMWCTSILRAKSN